jgi:hypothetical protein
MHPVRMCMGMHLRTIDVHSSQRLRIAKDRLEERLPGVR